MQNCELRRCNGEKGSTIVEFAIMLPLLILLCLGATDFGRLFYHGVTVANAASAGAFYGAQNNLKSGDFAGMELTAKADAESIDGVTAAADRYCDCPDSPGLENAVDCITATCGANGYGFPRLFVRIQVRQTFEAVAPYPGIPESVNVGRDGYMRVQ